MACTIKTANLSISIVKHVHRTRREFIFEQNLFIGNSNTCNEQHPRVSSHDNSKIIPTLRHPTRRSVFRSSFHQVRTKKARASLRTRCRTCMSNRSEFILVRRNHIVCCQERPGRVALCFDFVYCWCQSFFSNPFPLVRSCVFLSPSIHPSLPLYTAKPFGRYSAPSLQILYHFYEA